MYVIWLDEARARTGLQAAYATYRACAALSGARKGDLPDLADPADEFTGGAGAPARPRDPAERAAELSAFIAATGGDT